ncbi:hypothetical protein ACYFX5_14105 [Bremerella sp. T1]|uniref:hypothetical protein n=1 Tax=Bremerella sp. TYQ1 TaxID=3119568 RepID=UPI001CCB8D36|nr:hypothetical protein [Bremerella volcania]UBM34191.1 hypothetical protein LA756_16045 [Bremerella volcania]
MTDSTAKESNTTARRPSGALRWSLRAFFLLIAIAAVGFGWISYQMRVGQMHEDASQRIAQLGGHVSWQLEQKAPLQPASPQMAIGSYSMRKGGPDWMKALGAEPVFQRIKFVHLNYRISPEQFEQFLQEVKQLVEVEGVYIGGNPITAAQLEDLLTTVEIEKLGIRETTIGRKPLPFLRDTKLTDLILVRTHASDVLLDDLPETLKYLNLTRTRITDEGLPKLARLKNLNTLQLKRTPTSKEAMDALEKQLPRCFTSWSPLEKK